MSATEGKDRRSTRSGARRRPRADRQRTFVPALDGIRGLAMVIFMAFHLGVTQLQGAWVVVNLFFVLSGFLIVRILAAERARIGHLRFLAFYRRRARRLLPALFLLLAAVIGYGVLFADEAEAKGLRGDIVATLTYVMNWRLVAQGNQYFDHFGQPSPLKHAWTLSVEEQFYLLVPFLVLGLFAYLRTRRARVASLLGLAVVSAVWTALIGVGDPQSQAHAYYGTDTRAQALLVGAALGVAFAPTRRGRLPWKLSATTVAVVGWSGLVFFAVAIFAIGPFNSWMFNGGGLLVSCLLAGALVIACADSRPSALKVIVGWAPVAYLGRLSYALYLWHWPINLWLHRAAPLWPMWLHLAVGLVLTTLVAAASYELVERRVVRDGLRGLVGSRGRGRVLVATATAALLAGTASISATASPASAQSRGAQWVLGYPELVAGQPPYQRPTKPVGIALWGDSVPTLLHQNFPRDNFPGLQVDNLAVPGCDLLEGTVQYPPPLPPAVNPPACDRTKRAFADQVAKTPASQIVVFGSPLFAFTHKVDGRNLSWGDPQYSAMIERSLTGYLTAIRAAGKQMQLVTIPCRTADSIPTDVYRAATSNAILLEETKFATRANALLAQWGRTNNVPVVDLNKAICGNGPRTEVAGIQLFGDGIHFSAAATPLIWGWLAPQIIANAKTRV